MNKFRLQSAVFVAVIVTMLVLMAGLTGGVAQALSGSTSQAEVSEPLHLRVIWTEDPATKARISWSTEGRPAQTFLKLIGPDAKERKLVPQSGLFEGSDPELYYHHVDVRDLQPGTPYKFEVICDGKKSARLYFVTSPGRDVPFSLLHGGDSRTDHANRRKVNQMMADLVTKSYQNEDPADNIIALAHGGDFVNNGDNLGQWKAWLSDHQLTIGPDGRVLPVIPTRGNHDQSELFNQVFGFPPKDKNYYAINLNPVVRWVTLNTEISTAGDQAKWLGKELKASRPKHRWLVAQYHRPAYPAVKTPGTALQSWVPLFEKHDVDLVCEADGHNIKRTVPIRGNVQDKTGVVYIGEGGLGVAQRTPKTDRWYLQPPGMASSASHVFQLTFHSDRLETHCICLDGTLADQFEIKPRKIEKVQAFFVSGDPQYLAENAAEPTKLDPFSEEANQRFLELLKKMPGKSIPEPQGGGSVSKQINGMVVTGDLVDSADKSGGNYPQMQRFEWERYKKDYGLTGEEDGLPYPVYELHGNHDGPQGDTFIVEDIIARNKTRPGLVNLSENGLHYSWDWGPLHLVCLGIFVGAGDERREGFHYAPRQSLEFLKEDLAQEVGDSGRPVILAFHLHPHGPEFDWPPEDLQAFGELAKSYNVIGMFHGHTHGSPPSRLQWRDGKFGGDLSGGIDLFNPDDSGAAKTDSKQPDQPVGIRHGFLYVEVRDRPGTERDEWVVRSIYTDDNWATYAWGQTWTKAIQIPRYHHP